MKKNSAKSNQKPFNPIKPTAAEKKAATKLQTPVKQGSMQTLIKKAAVAQSQESERELEWTNAASLVGSGFTILRMWEFESASYGSKVGFEIRLQENGEKFLLSLPLNKERAELCATFNETRQEQGPYTFNELPPTKAGYKPYLKLVEWVPF